MEPVYHVVLNIAYEDGRIRHDSVCGEFPGNREGFKLAAAERTRLEAEYLSYHPAKTDCGGTAYFEIEMW
jgi:hypothetical protein